MIAVQSGSSYDKLNERQPHLEVEMDVEDALGTPGRLQLNFPGANTSRNDGDANGKKLRRQSNEGRSTFHPKLSTILSTTSGQGQPSGYDECISEVARNFTFQAAPANYQDQQRASSSRDPLSVDTSRNGLSSFAQPGTLRARRSQQFLPPSASNAHAMQKSDSRAAFTPAVTQQMDAPTNTITSRGGQSRPAQGNTTRMELQPRNLAQQSPFTPLASVQVLETAHTRQVFQAEHFSEPEVEYTEESYQNGAPVESGEHDRDDRQYYTNEDPSHFGDAEQQNFDAETYPEKFKEDIGEPVQSQDAATDHPLVPVLPAGFVEHFDEYLMTHQQEAYDAEQKWKNATLEEWKAGKFGKSFPLQQ